MISNFKDYNIRQVILDAANVRNLEAMATGGGMDYIVRYLGKEEDGAVAPVLVLGIQGDGGSPTRLDEPSIVTLYLTENWAEEWVSFTFNTVVDAMDFMRGFTGSTIQRNDESEVRKTIIKNQESEITRLTERLDEMFGLFGRMALTDEGCATINAAKRLSSERR